MANYESGDVLKKDKPSGKNLYDLCDEVLQYKENRTNFQSYLVEQDLSISHTEMIQVMHELRNENYVKDFAHGLGIITAKGKTFINEGGYKESIKQEKERKNLESKQLKYNVFQLKYWWLLLVINTIITIVVAYLTAKISK